jgi:hypothetical protein
VPTPSTGNEIGWLQFVHLHLASEFIFALLAGKIALFFPHQKPKIKSWPDCRRNKNSPKKQTANDLLVRVSIKRKNQAAAILLGCASEAKNLPAVASD